VIHVPAPARSRQETAITVRAAHTGGAMGAIEQTLQPRELVPPHTHTNDVWLLVRSGSVGVLVDEEIATGGPGSWLLKPRGIQHAMWNPTDEPADILEVFTPGGFEGFFEEIRGLSHDDRDGFEAICDRYGIRFEWNSPWVEELGRRYGVR
jgi:quercetin dioxygenase-like cupin family protein